MLVQRWLFQHEVWRPADEPARVGDYEVVHTRSVREVKDFIIAHHYAGSMPVPKECFKVYERRTAEMVGAGVYGVPMNPASLWRFPDPSTATELCRFILLDRVRGNGESMIVQEMMRQMRRLGYEGVLSHSDPTPRKKADGSIIHKGHVGIIYQSLSALYDGRTAARTLRVLPNGKVLNDRARSKIRALDKAHGAAARLLEENGAEPLDRALRGLSGDAARDAAGRWLELWEDRLTVHLKHEGNHRYLFPLTPQVRRHILQKEPALESSHKLYPAPPGGRVPPKWGRRASA